jgi:hypothetical protein
MFWRAEWLGLSGKGDPYRCKHQREHNFHDGNNVSQKLGNPVVFGMAPFRQSMAQGLAWRLRDGVLVTKPSLVGITKNIQILNKSIGTLDRFALANELPFFLKKAVVKASEHRMRLPGYHRDREFPEGLNVPVVRGEGQGSQIFDCIQPCGSTGNASGRPTVVLKMKIETDQNGQGIFGVHSNLHIVNLRQNPSPFPGHPSPSTPFGGIGALPHLLGSACHLSGLIPDRPQSQNTNYYQCDSGGILRENQFMEVTWRLAGMVISLPLGILLIYHDDWWPSIISRLLCRIGGFGLVGVGLGLGFFPIYNQGCEGNYHERYSHSGKIVTQQYLTGLYLCNTVIAMANVLNTDKQIAVIGPLAEGSSIRSIERISSQHGTP